LASVKIKEGWAKCLSNFFEHLYTFYGAPLDRLGTLQSGEQKQNICQAALKIPTSNYFLKTNYLPFLCSFLHLQHMLISCFF